MKFSRCLIEKSVGIVGIGRFLALLRKIRKRLFVAVTLILASVRVAIRVAVGIAIGIAVRIILLLLPHKIFSFFAHIRLEIDRRAFAQYEDDDITGYGHEQGNQTLNEIVVRRIFLVQSKAKHGQKQGIDKLNNRQKIHTYDKYLLRYRRKAFQVFPVRRAELIVFRRAFYQNEIGFQADKYDKDERSEDLSEHCIQTRAFDGLTEYSASTHHFADIKKVSEGNKHKPFMFFGYLFRHSK